MGKNVDALIDFINNNPNNFKYILNGFQVTDATGLIYKYNSIDCSVRKILKNVKDKENAKGRYCEHFRKYATFTFYMNPHATTTLSTHEFVAIFLYYPQYKNLKRRLKGQQEPVVCHKDGNKYNNRPHNVEWGTSENNSHHYEIVKGLHEYIPNTPYTHIESDLDKGDDMIVLNPGYSISNYDLVSFELSVGGFDKYTEEERIKEFIKFMGW